MNYIKELLLYVVSVVSIVVRKSCSQWPVFL